MIKEWSKPAHVVPSFEPHGDLTVRPRVGLTHPDLRLIFVGYAVSEEEGDRVATVVANRAYEYIFPSAPEHYQRVTSESTHEFLRSAGLEHFDVLRCHDNTLLYVTHTVPGVENTYIVVDSGAVYRLRPEKDVLSLVLVAFPEHDEKIEDVAELLSPEDIKEFARDFRTIRNYRAIDHAGEPGSLDFGDLLTLFQLFDVRDATYRLDETGTLMHHIVALREERGYTPDVNEVFLSRYKPLSSFLRDEYRDVLEATKVTKERKYSVLLSTVVDGSSVRYACINAPFEPHDVFEEKDNSWTPEQWRKYYELYREALSLVWEIPAHVTTEDVGASLPTNLWDIPARMDRYGRRLNLTTLGEYDDFCTLHIGLMKADLQNMREPKGFVHTLFRKRK